MYSYRSFFSKYLQKIISITTLNFLVCERCFIYYTYGSQLKCAAHLVYHCNFDCPITFYILFYFQIQQNRSFNSTIIFTHGLKIKANCTHTHIHTNILLSFLKIIKNMKMFLTKLIL